MRRNRADFIAIGAILSGAVIGAGGTMAFVGNPLERSASATLECGSVWQSANGQDAVWLITVSEDGERRVKRCPRRTWRFRYWFQPAQVDGERVARYYHFESRNIRNRQEALERIQTMRQELEEKARTMARENAVVVHYSR